MYNETSRKTSRSRTQRLDLETVSRPVFQRFWSRLGLGKSWWVSVSIVLSRTENQTSRSRLGLEAQGLVHIPDIYYYNLKKSNERDIFQNEFFLSVHLPSDPHRECDCLKDFVTGIQCCVSV